jgi:hypothetical protein
MVKSIIYTLSAIVLSVGFFIFTEFYIRTQFDQFHTAVESLYDKVENHTANREDGYAVKDMWADKKKKLHIFIPHNDISYIDYWLNEACALIYTQNYDLALGKVEVLKEITTNLPDAYSISLENVF